MNKENKELLEEVQKDFKEIKEALTKLKNAPLEKFLNAVTFYSTKLINPASESAIGITAVKNDSDLLSTFDIYKESGVPLFSFNLPAQYSTIAKVALFMEKYGVKKTYIVSAGTETLTLNLTDEEYNILKTIEDKFNEIVKKIELKNGESVTKSNITLSGLKTVLLPKENEAVAVYPVPSVVMIYKIHKEIAERGRTFTKKTYILKGVVSNKKVNMNYLLTKITFGLNAEFKHGTDKGYLFIYHPEVFVNKIKNIFLKQEPLFKDFYKMKKSLEKNKKGRYRKLFEIEKNRIHYLMEKFEKFMEKELKEELYGYSPKQIEEAAEKALKKGFEIFKVLNFFGNNAVIEGELDKKYKVAVEMKFWKFIEKQTKQIKIKGV